MIAITNSILYVFETIPVLMTMFPAESTIMIAVGFAAGRMTKKSVVK